MVTYETTRFSFRKCDRGFWKQFWYVNVAYTTYFFYGLMRGYPVFAIRQMKLPEASDISVATGMSFFTNPIGSMIAGYLMDKWGRKFTMILSMLMFSVGWTVTALSTTFQEHNIGNSVIGMAIGMAACSPTYVAEISKTRYRSMFLSILEIHFALGVLIATVAICFLNRSLSAAIFAYLAIISTIIMLSIPETPYWLVKKKCNSDAIRTFCKLRDPTKSAENDGDFDDIVKSCSEGDVQTKGLVQTFIENFRIFTILLGLHVLLQGCGYSALLAHLTILLESFEIDPQCNASYFITIGFVSCQFIISFLTPITVHIWPRKKVTVLSGIGMSIPLIIMSIFSTFPHNMNFLKSYVEYVIATCLYLYLCACTIGILTLSQAMIGELYPIDARGKMVGITEAVSCILSGSAVSAFPILNNIIGMPVILYFFTLCSILTVFYGFFILPETFGKSLNEIQEQYFSKFKCKKTEVIRERSHE